MQFIFSQQAEKEFLHLEKSIQNNIRKKLTKIKEGGGYSIKLFINMSPFTHRLRIDDFRLLLIQCEEGFEVLKIGHRSTIYK